MAFEEIKNKGGVGNVCLSTAYVLICSPCTDSENLCNILKRSDE